MSSESWGTRRSSVGTVISRAFRSRMMKKKNKSDKTASSEAGEKKNGKAKKKLVDEHRLLSSDLNELTVKVEGLVAILLDLKDKFAVVKDLPCVMARAKIYGELLQEAVDKYNSPQNQDEANVNMSHNASPGHLNMFDIVKLAMKKRRKMVEARSVRGRYQNMSQSAQLADAPYDNMEVEQLKEELQALEADIQTRSMEISEVDGKLQQMQNDFTEAKNDWCWKRAARYKAIIADAIVDCM